MEVPDDHRVPLMHEVVGQGSHDDRPSKAQKGSSLGAIEHRPGAIRRDDPDHDVVRSEARDASPEKAPDAEAGMEMKDQGHDRSHDEIRKRGHLGPSKTEALHPEGVRKT